MSLIQEFRRRNVHRVAIGYLASAWLLIQIVETLFPVFGLPDTAIRAVVIVLAIGFLPALILSWLFEWTPDGVHRDSTNESRFRPRDTRWVDRTITATLALAVVYFAVDKFILGDPTPEISAYDTSIAVLAFDDLSPDGSEEHFADGISEEILNVLAGIPELHVSGRTSAFSFKGKDATIREIGEALDVAYVLEGSVRRSGDRIRITAQLIEAGSDVHLWSETYDRAFGDVFAIQDEIAEKIADSLHVQIVSKRAKSSEVDPRAYARYLQARNIMNAEGNDEWSRIPILLEQALAIEPDYADAIALNARYLWLMGTPGDSREETYERVRRLIDRALASNSSDALALNFRGFMAMVLDNDVVTAARYKQQAHELAPTNHELLWASALTLPMYGRADLAVTVGEYIVERDPLCMRCIGNLAGAYEILGDFEKAESLYQDGLEVNPEWIGGYIGLTETYVLWGQPDKALEIAERLPHGDLGEEHRYVLPASFVALHDAGRLDQFEALWPKYREIHVEELPLLMAQVHAWLGNADEAFQWLDRHDRAMTWGIRIHLTRPWYRKLHDDPRWQALLEKYGMSEEQLEVLDLDLRLPR